MELKPAKRKQCTTPHGVPFIPIPANDYIKAYYNGVYVYVDNIDEMKVLCNMGYYGKGSLSRSEPVFEESSDILDNIILEQQWLNRTKGGYSEKVDHTFLKNQQLIYETSILNYLNTPYMDSSILWEEQKRKLIKPVSESKECSTIDTEWESNSTDNKSSSAELSDLVDSILCIKELRSSPNFQDRKLIVAGGPNGAHFEEYVPSAKEVLQLSSYECFFLSWAVGVLRVFDICGKCLTVPELWNHFRRTDSKFVHRYCVYHWYRSRGWIVRSGLKYGGDFLLYEKGPKYCHSSYLVIVHSESSHKKTWSELIMYQRLVETFNKDLINCTVSPKTEISHDDFETPHVLSKFKVQEVLCRRWIPSQQRLSK